MPDIPPKKNVMSDADLSPLAAMIRARLSHPQVGSMSLSGQSTPYMDPTTEGMMSIWNQITGQMQQPSVQNTLVKPIKKN